jgi:serine/threonine protein kinase
LTRRGQKFSLFFTSVNQDPDWISKLNHFCIKLDFLNKYEVLSEIGQGATSIVYKVIRKPCTHYSNELRKCMAAKVINKTKVIKDKQSATFLLKEIQILKILTMSPNVTELTRIYEDEEVLILLMSYHQQGTLNQFLIENGK